MEERAKMHTDRQPVQVVHVAQELEATAVVKVEADRTHHQAQERNQAEGEEIHQTREVQ